MPKSELLELYQSMLRIRRVEETLSEKYAENLIHSPLFLCIGEEAIAAGVSHWLDNSDYVFSGHRAHGHYLAKGGDLQKLINHYFFTDQFSPKGQDGGLYLLDKSVGFMGSTPISAGTVPLAVGAALAFSIQNRAQVTLVYFGDGAFEQGVVHEALNFSKLKNLPIVFICENNNYSGYTHIDERQPHREIVNIAEAHGVASYAGNGNDVLNVSTIAQFAINQARDGYGPQFIEYYTHRWREHCGPYFDDDLGYRRGGELEYWLQHCPIKNALTQLYTNGTLTEQQNKKLELAIKAEVDEAIKNARQNQQQANKDNSHVA